MAWDPHKGAKAAAELEAATADVAREVAALLAQNGRLRKALATRRAYAGPFPAGSAEEIEERLALGLPPGPGPSF
jgi:hypothetical protein